MGTGHDDNIIEMFANDINSLIEEKDDTMKMTL